MSQNLTEKFTKLSVLVLGDFMLDEYIHGSVERISPEAPVPVELEKKRTLVPGGAGNVVKNLHSLGARVKLAGVIGEDQTGKSLRGIFTELGIREEDNRLLEIPGRSTTRKTRILAGNQQVCRLDRESEGTVDERTEELILEEVRRALPDIQAIIFSDYDKGVITPAVIRKTVELADPERVFLAVDPQVSHFHFYENVHVLTPNHHEAGAFLKRKLLSDEEVQEGGFEILDRLAARMLLITRGDRGMTLFQSSPRSFEHIPVQAREVYDVTGAGDTVISVFTMAMAAGYAPREAVDYSNKAAGIVVARLGAAAVTPEQLT